MFKVNIKNTRTMSMTLNIFHTLFWCLYRWLWTSKCQLGQCDFWECNANCSSFSQSMALICVLLLMFCYSFLATSYICSLDIINSNDIFFWCILSYYSVIKEVIVSKRCYTKNMGKYMNFFTYTLLDVIYRKADSLIQNNILFNSKNSLVEQMNPTPPLPLREVEKGYIGNKCINLLHASVPLK